MADGRKMLPMLVFKGKRMPKGLKEINGAVVSLTKNGWI